MVRTTIEIEDELYRKLVDESIRKFGSTKNLSRLVNEKLKASKIHANELKLPEINFGKKIDWKFVEKSIENIEESWKL